VYNVVCAYFPPDCDSELLTEQIVEALMHLDVTLPTVVGGDFNARLDVVTDKTDNLCEVLADFGFMVKNSANIPTYIAPNGQSTIDLVFVNVGRRVFGGS
jgi:hypothetical protein